MATLWGCQNEEDVFDNTLKQTNLVVTASLEGNADSRTALENAGSVASTLLTTEVIITDKEEKLDTKNPNAPAQSYGIY